MAKDTHSIVVATENDSIAGVASRLRLRVLLSIIVLSFCTVLCIASLEAASNARNSTIAFHFAVCDTQSPLRSPTNDLVASFLSHQGARSIRTSGDERLLTVSGLLPGGYRWASVSVTHATADDAFAALARGDCNIELAESELNPIQAEMFHRLPTSETIALDGVVAVTHPSNGVRTISPMNLKKIFDGEIRSWAAVGGRHSEIRVVAPLAHADELTPFIEQIMHGSAPRAHLTRSSDVAAYVASHDGRDAIGVTTFHASSPATIVASYASRQTQGAASMLSIGRRTYPMMLILRAFHIDGSMSPSSYAFASYLDSVTAQGVLIRDGFVSPFIF